MKLKNDNITNRQNYHKNNYVCIKINGRGKTIAKVWGPCDVGKPEIMENRIENWVRQMKDRENRGKWYLFIVRHDEGSTRWRYNETYNLSTTSSEFHNGTFHCDSEDDQYTIEHEITDARWNVWDNIIHSNKLRTIVFYVEKRKYHSEIEIKERIIITGTRIGRTH